MTVEPHDPDQRHPPERRLGGVSSQSNDVLVGLSIDGPRRTARRATAATRPAGPTFDRVMRGLGHLREHGVAWNALTAVHAANAEHPVERLPLPARRLWGHVHPVHPHRRAADAATACPTATPSTERSVTAQQWGAVPHRRSSTSGCAATSARSTCRCSTSALANWYGEPPALCVHSPTCGTALALEFNGDVYSCDHFVEPGPPAGQHRRAASGRPGRLAGAAALRAGQARRAAGRAVVTATVLFACHGGCPKDRFVAAP